MRNRLYELFNTNMTKNDNMLQMRKEFHLSDEKFYVLWDECFTAEESRNRKRRLYRLSKLGNKNPQFGHFGKDAGAWKGGRWIDEWGYARVRKPKWYTGATTQDYVGEHVIVMCLALGVTELPTGYVVHHIDEDKQNNSIKNLQLMTVSEHMRLHALERASTIERVALSGEGK